MKKTQSWSRFFSIFLARKTFLKVDQKKICAPDSKRKKKEKP
jgi:hypothetical protein